MDDLFQPAWWQAQLSGLSGLERAKKAVVVLREAGFSRSGWTRRMEKIDGVRLIMAPFGEFAKLERDDAYIPAITQESVCLRCTGTGMNPMSNHDENCRTCAGRGFVVAKKPCKRVPRLAKFGVIKRKAPSVASARSLG